MRPIRIVLLALVVLLAAVPALHAQAPAGEAATEAAAVSSSGAPASTEAAAPAADAAAQTGASLPRSTPPRTLRAYTHVFAAFAVAWVLLFGYLVFVARKFRRVEEQVNALARS